MFLFWFLYIYVINCYACNSFSEKSSILVQIILYISNSLSPSIRKDINLIFLFLSSPLSLNIVTYPLFLGNIKTNGLIISSNYPIKYCFWFQLIMK